MSNCLEAIFEEDKEKLIQYVERSLASEQLQRIKLAFETYVKSGDIQCIYNVLGEEKVASLNASVPTKPTRKKQVLQSTDNEKNILENVFIKIEKMSILPEPTETAVALKQEPEDMPAPTKLPPKKRKVKQEPVELPKRSTRTRKKPNKFDSNNEPSDGKRSDVILQNTTVTTIELNDSTDAAETVVESTRTTRTKTRKNQVDKTVHNNLEKKLEEPSGEQISKPIKNKRDRSKEDNELENKLKKSKSTSSSDTEANKTNQTEYEDAVSTVESNEAAKVNETYVATKPHINIKDKNEINADQSTPSKPKSKVTKPIFSPYSNSTTKKKIEAFEKLVDSSSKIPRKFAQTERAEPEPHKTKSQTPLNPRFKPLSSSTVKVSKVLPGKTDTPNNSAHTNSALKASQAEFRERGKRQLEKEREALKKKDALLQALTEERRKKREEKQLKAQLQREQQEKEKQKLLQIQQEKKRMLAQKMASELHNKEMEKREEVKELQKVADKVTADMKNMTEVSKQMALQKKHQKLPVYMTTKPPLLPTEDCYDSDDAQHGKARYKLPAWATEKNLTIQQRCMQLIGESIKNTFFCRKIHTPNLQELFEFIDPHKLKRTSSAVWRKPPRYTLFSMTQDIVFSDDED